MKAELPVDESLRLTALREYGILDTPPEADFDDIAHLASEICGTPIAAVSLIDRNRQWFKTAVGLTVRETPRDVAFCAHAILQDDVLVIPDAREDVRFADNPLVTGEPRIRFYAGAPLVSPDGQALGTLCVIDRETHVLTDGQTRSLRALSRQVMAQLELRRHVADLQSYRETLEKTNARLEIESITDDVTGFHNTRFLHQYLDQRLGAGTLSLAFFDMDRFKRVVDTHGHLLGAKVLRETAEAIHAQLDDDDRIVRYGGDEYVVILPDQNADRAFAKTERMREAIRSTRFLHDDGLDVRVTASFGIATYPDDAQDARRLLAVADEGLFASKAAGKDRVSRGTNGASDRNDPT